MKIKTKQNVIEKAKRISILPNVELPILGRFFKPEEMPLVDASPIGRHRLIQALRGKYGPAFRNVRGVSEAIKEYDNQVEHIRKLYKTLE